MKDDEPFAMAGIWEEFADKITGRVDPHLCNRHM